MTKKAYNLTSVKYTDIFNYTLIIRINYEIGILSTK